MLHIQGSPALSDFRLNKLLDELKARVPAVSGLASHYVHFADVSETLDEDESSILAKLLQYGPRIEDVECEGTLFLVTPRAGTISPWSSKATDIAHNCNLNKI